MDKIFEAFLRRQQEESKKLVQETDLLRLVPNTSNPPQAYLAHFFCKGFVWPGADVAVAEQHLVEIHFPGDYLRRAEPIEIIRWRGPREIFHPNISDKAPLICIGHLAPGTPLVDILDQVFEIITWNKVTMREDDALNKTACQWARNNQNRFPVDSRPLRRRATVDHDRSAGIIIEEVLP